MRNSILWSLLSLALAASPAYATAPEPKTDEQKAFYALGLMMSQSLSPFTLNEAELETVKAGVTDGVLKRSPKVDLKQIMPKVQQLHDARAGAAAAVEKKAGEAFLAKAAAEKGATKTESGLVISTIKAGTGNAPKKTDKVKVHYHGALIDGTVFDSSVQRKEPATFALDGVIPCWTEGVQRMKVGGKARLVCPAQLAYGDRGAPPQIKPGATLVFDVELLDIIK